MIKTYSLLTVLFLSLGLSSCNKSKEKPTELDSINETIVEHFGQLKVDGKQILDQDEEIVVLRGMSLFWSQWGADYYNEETIRWLRDDWKCTVVRAAIGVENGGCLENKLLELTKLYVVIEACIDLGIYVIVDWHDHHAEDHVNEAVEFFGAVSSKYDDYPNIIYEIYNEPLQIDWSNVLKPYADTIVNEIRKSDPDNIIVVGTPNWSQDVEDVIGNTIDDSNIVYSLHFYASTHKQFLRNKANTAISANIPIFVTEWGLSEATGTGTIDIIETNLWIDFLENNNLGWCNWSIINKDETSAALLPSTSAIYGWSENELTQSGKFIRNYLITKNSEIFDKLE